MSDTQTPDSSSESTAVTPFYLDKALYVLVLGALLPILNAKFGWNLNTEQVAAVLLAVVAYVAGHKWKAGTVRAAEIHQATQVQVAQIAASTPKTPAGVAGNIASL